MCEFVSWIEGPSKRKGQKQVWYLTDHEMYETSRGQELREWSASNGDEDCLGHGAIRWYYELPPEKGQDRERTGFSTPANFPPQIAQPIVQGAFRRLVREVPAGLLSRALDADYWAKRKPLDADYWAELADPDNRAEAWRAV